MTERHEKDMNPGGAITKIANLATESYIKPISAPWQYVDPLNNLGIGRTLGAFLCRPRP